MELGSGLFTPPPPAPGDDGEFTADLHTYSTYSAHPIHPHTRNGRPDEDEAGWRVREDIPEINCVDGQRVLSEFAVNGQKD